MRRLLLLTCAATVVLSLGTAPLAGASVSYHGTAVFPSSLTASAPLVTVTFHRAVTAAEMPALRTSPSLVTSWTQLTPDSVAAVTTSSLSPGTSYLLNVPTGISCATTCSPIGHTSAVVSVYASVTLLDQLLARLNYLPVSFTPTTPQALSNTAEVPGTFAWRFAALPKVLSALWQVGTTNVVLRGAVMRFQGVHNLTTTGVANGATWQALIAAIRVHQVDPDPYDYVYVSEREPETLDLYRNGHLIFISLVNTGVAAAPTAPGTYPVYVRYLTTTMSGTEPDGKKYNDPGIPWVSYFHGGDALHGFIRSSYGWPQSLGCVEMPFANAHRVFPWTPIGTLVSIS